MERGPKPVEILGPPGIAGRMTDLFEALYPSLSSLPKDFEIRYRELEPAHTRSWRGIQISAHEVVHFSGVPLASPECERWRKTLCLLGGLRLV